MLTQIRFILFNKTGDKMNDEELNECIKEMRKLIKSYRAAKLRYQAGVAEGLNLAILILLGEN